MELEISPESFHIFKSIISDLQPPSAQICPYKFIISNIEPSLAVLDESSLILWTISY